MNYIITTIINGRHFGFNTSKIVIELIKGLPYGYNTLTEI